MEYHIHIGTYILHTRYYCVSICIIVNIAIFEKIV